jgi:Tfp pilus assembly protein PilV
MIETLKSERGTTLIETVIATGMLLVVMAGLLGMASLATQYTENHGHLEARTTEYAQDKMEQLLALAYGDSIRNTVNFPATDDGTGLGPSTLAVNATAGTVDLSATPVNLYVDWLAANGNLLGGGTTAPAGWFYKRVWQITCIAGPCSSNPPVGLKQITVTATVRMSVGAAILPKSTVVALKASEF